MKAILNRFLILISLLLFSCGDGDDRNIVDIEVAFSKGYFEFEAGGLASFVELANLAIGEKRYFEHYPNSYVENRRHPETGEIRVFFHVDNDDYRLNFESLNGRELGGLPGGRPVPGAQRYGGGDGAGNGFVAHSNAEYEGEEVVIYQNGRAFGIFYPLEINNSGIVSFRHRTSGYKGFVSLVGKDENEENSGIILSIPEFVELRDLRD